MSSEDDDQLSHDLEKSGYLLKKTSKGIWVNRFFVTERNILSYWHDQNSFEQHDKASETYDIAEIKNVERTSNRGLQVNFLNSSKFKLEVRALMDNERNEWATLLEAKCKLYSVDELLSDLRQHHFSFKTKTFESLMFLHEKDQNKWILDRLDEIFEISEDDSKSVQLRSNSSRLLSAGCRALDEYIAACEDCKLEMTSREPKIVAHTRNYIKRYAEILKGRLTLELLYLPGVVQKSIEELGEKALCSALELANRFERLQAYPFVPKDLISTMSKTLFNLGDVLSALIKLSVRRVDAFFEELTKTSPSLRSKRLCDITSLLNEIVSSIRDDIHDHSLFRLTLQQMLQTQLLAYSDHFSLMDMSDYEELPLMDHIKACDRIYERLSNCCIDLGSRLLIKEDADIKEEVVTGTEESQWLRIPPSVLDCMKSTCDDSARSAFLRAVYILQDAKKYLLENMFHELADGWMGGILCKALVNTLSQWVDTVREIMPKKFVRVTFVETSRLMIVMYINRMISLYQSKKSITLSPKGILQMKSDLKTIQSWIVDNTQQDECIAEKALLETLIDGFVVCADSDGLQAFAVSIRLFGTKHEWALYDLFRLVLKYRSDISVKARKHMLALCCDFLTQLHNATQTDPHLVGGEISNTTIIDMLFPTAGVEHCTGTKWKLEKSADPGSTKLMVTLAITDTINDALENRRRFNIMSSSGLARTSNAQHEKLESPPQEELKVDETCSSHEKLESLPQEESKVEVEKLETSNPEAVHSESETVANNNEIRRDHVSAHRPPPPRPPPPPRRATVIGVTTAIESSSTNVSAPSLSQLGLFSRVENENPTVEPTNVEPTNVVPRLSPPATMNPFDEPSYTGEVVVAVLIEEPEEVERSSKIASIKTVVQPPVDEVRPPPARTPPPKPQRRASAPALPSEVTSRIFEPAHERVTEQEAVALLLQSAKKRLEENHL